MNSTTREDPSTEAVIEVTDSPETSYGGSAAPKFALGNLATQASNTALSKGYAPPKTETTTIVNTVAFSYSSDITQLGDPFSVTIPDPRGRYKDKFRRGQTIKLGLRNPNVEGGALTTKALGLITNRVRTCNASGSKIELTCADLGWHLLNCDAPYWYNLQEPTWSQLLADPNWIHPSWGIRGVRESNDTNRLLKQRLNVGRAAIQIELQSVLGSFLFIQAEPGDKIADHLATFARRANLLLNVSCDGYIQLWRPDYARDPLFSIELHDLSDLNRNKNNVLDVTISDSVDDIYTEVNCLWDAITPDLLANTTDQNFYKDVGSFFNPYALPFYRRFSWADGDIYDNKDAAQQALWRYQKGVFDSWQAVYTVKGHWQKPAGAQRSYWWESDQMCSVNDTVNGLSGNFYIASVRCDRDDRGDRTIVTLRKPCLQANFGEYKQPTIDTGGIVDFRGVTETTAQHTKVTERAK